MQESNFTDDSHQFQLFVRQQGYNRLQNQRTCLINKPKLATTIGKCGFWFCTLWKKQLSNEISLRWKYDTTKHKCQSFSTGVMQSSRLTFCLRLNLFKFNPHSSASLVIVQQTTKRNERGHLVLIIAIFTTRSNKFWIWFSVDWPLKK